MRGKLISRRPRARAERIIPARAGQTRASRSPPARHTDHPRACGANVSAGYGDVPPIGSSPRVRGKPRRDDGGNHAIRIIPARAGQTVYHVRPSISASDHPRACGANHDTMQSVSTSSGSSPRVRGKLGVPCVVYFTFRIIPARAGQTGKE